jgi:ATP-dependent helicase HrpA
VPNDALLQARIAPQLTFKHAADLPISARREEITDALQRHQVLIVAGDTGSGKSTQLPQYCLALGRGREGLIAHTQPRRLAARALAARIAEELSQPVGLTVGFRVRFADQVSDATRLVLMTDGLLLAELGRDPELRRYDTVIVDEAHERSLNVDLLLGVLKRVLPRRPDLKVIVTSATLEVERVARFFDDAPVLTVSGRHHPIEVRYAAPPDDSLDPDLPAAVLAAYQDIDTAPGAAAAGDGLVYLPGEREIRDVAELLERELKGGVEVLTLYSRLSWEQQSKIFKQGARRRIVLATNVAETSITVPGIRAVIDSGLARVSRYSSRNRLQRLPIEPISRASADQRKGRCGRTLRNPRSCEPILPRCYCVWPRMVWGKRSNSHSWILRIRGRSATAIACCKSCRHWMRRAASRAAAAPWRACRSTRAWRERCSRANASMQRASCWRSSRV